MKIFLSHAVADKELATKIKELIQAASMGLVDVWMSSAIDGLKPGDILWLEVHENLTKSDKILTLLTPNSLGRDWLLYESGYVAGKKESPVIPLLFGLTKTQLPLPLSAYVIYNGDDLDELNNLIYQIITEVAPNPSLLLVSSLTSSFLIDISTILQLISDKSKKSKLNSEDLLPQFLNKLDASELFHKKLADPSIEHICIVTYTNEVEAGTLNHYRVKGNKTIEIYKRSILSDLRQQQIINLRRLLHGSKVKPWNKMNISLDASMLVEKCFSENPDVSVAQYLYDAPPTKRAYLFNHNEAIVSFYETANDPLIEGGSIYKGMTGSNCLYAKRGNPYGDYIIDELINHINSLKLNSRTWIEEREILDSHHKTLRNISSMPCLNPKAVFFDLDGVLYNSLPNYSQAWRAAFKEVSFELPENEVYLLEGRSGIGTVEDIFKKYKGREPSQAEIDKVIDKKKEVLISIGAPPIQTGALELLDATFKAGLQLFVVTGSTHDQLKDKVVSDFPIIKDQHRIITGIDVKYGKPHPEPYLIACKKANVSSSEAIVIENAPLGIRSATEAGIFCLAVNTGILSDETLIESGASVVFSGCDHLAKNWDQVIRILGRA
ncbi:MAG: HAD hydrolase-like protein [Pedobacter sp.]